MSERSAINLEIEYLRAVAVLLVIFAHLDALFPGLGLGQWTGVDLFFCISGYVISRSYQQVFDRSIAEGRWKTAALAFWIRRFFRLTPSAWFWLTVMVICSFIFNRPKLWFGTPQQALEAALSFLTFTTNFLHGTGNLHTCRFFWSLTLEDQFYLLFPIYLLIVRGHARWILFLVFIYLQSIPDRMLGTADHPSLLWTTRLDALMWGCLIYQLSCTAIYKKLEPVFLRPWPLALAVNILLIWCLITIPKGTFGPWIGYKIESEVALASAALVFLASFDRGYVLPLPAPARAVLTWIGSRSYALYLVHLPVFGILSESWYNWGPAYDPHIFYAVMIPILVPLLAELNFRLIETPLRQKGAQIAKQMMMRSSETRVAGGVA